MAEELNVLTDGAFEKFKRDHDSLKLMVKNLKLRMEGVRQGTVPAAGLIGYADEEIAGLTDTTPGSATVTIYKIDDAGELAVTFNSQLVFNVSDKAIAAESFFPVHREWPSARYVCYGKDEATGSGSGSGGNICEGDSYDVLTSVERVGDDLVYTRVNVQPNLTGCPTITALDDLVVDVCSCGSGSGSGSGAGEDCFDSMQGRDFVLSLTGDLTADLEMLFQPAASWSALATGATATTGWYASYVGTDCEFDFYLTYETTEGWVYWIDDYANRVAVSVTSCDPFTLEFEKDCAVDVGIDWESCNAMKGVGGARFQIVVDSVAFPGDADSWDPPTSDDSCELMNGTHLLIPNGDGSDGLRNGDWCQSPWPRHGGLYGWGMNCDNSTGVFTLFNGCTEKEWTATPDGSPTVVFTKSISGANLGCTSWPDTISVTRIS